MANAIHVLKTSRAVASMADEVRRALTARPRWLPCKYFYDNRGSELFEQITQLPEYYQTRTEVALLARISDDVVARAAPRELVELGSGAGRKIGMLLEASARAGRAIRLVLFDINPLFVDASARRIAAQFPGVDVHGLTGDFFNDLATLGPGGGRLAVFLAGTIGNLHPDDVPRFLSRIARQLEPDDALLVGLDLVKDTVRLEAAYNDAAGVTAEFNRNILRHVNRVLDADFDVDAWEHVAFYDHARAWIEMRLRATRNCRVRARGAGLDLRFRAGEEISTEISCKYTRPSFERMLPRTGLMLEQWYSDDKQMFALTLLRRVRMALRPV
ncbi:MAG: L-histidine N(alpha)-methyltransferase [Gammaproteobacteria bacterium]|nr:L-histidine N(alpha)-methyltransferase [Gammaproteobacteria bacterium]